MKPAKRPLTSCRKSVKVPEGTYKRRPLTSQLLPTKKEKQTAKSVRDNFETMVIRTPPTGESVLRYALPIPSSKTKEVIAEGEIIRNVTKRLKTVVSNLEEAYGHDIQNEVTPFENEELSLSVGKDLHSFLLCCSQFLTQLETSAKNKQHILESLFKWFQYQVNQMEEISKDQSILETALPEADNAVTFSFSQVVRQVQKLEELKNHLKQGSQHSWKSLFSKTKDTEKVPEGIQSFEDLLQKLEEIIKTYRTKENTEVSNTELLGTASVATQFNTMMEIFEKQSDTLERAANDQDLLEAKCKKMESDFQALSKEKSALEHELQKLKNTEITQKTKLPAAVAKTVNVEKKKDKGKQKKPVTKDTKSKELSQAQKFAYDLERENLLLQEKMKQALQETEKARSQLTYFLKEGRDLFKGEGKRKSVITEMGVGKIKNKDRESKNIILENEPNEDSSEQNTSDKIQKHA